MTWKIFRACESGSLFLALQVLVCVNEDFTPRRKLPPSIWCTPTVMNCTVTYLDPSLAFSPSEVWRFFSVRLFCSDSEVMLKIHLSRLSRVCMLSYACQMIPYALCFDPDLAGVPSTADVQAGWKKSRGNRWVSGSSSGVWCSLGSGSGSQ